MKIDREKSLSFLNRLIEWSLYVLIFSLPFSKTAIEVCAIIAIICWVLKKSLSGRAGLKLAHTDLNLPLGIFYLVGFLSIFWSTHTDISISAFIRKLTEYILLYFIVVETVSERKIVRNIVTALAVSAFIVCVDGIYQRFTGYDFIRGYPMFSAKRLTGPFKFPNGLSAWLLIVSLPFISLALFCKNNLKLKTANSILAVLLAYCLFLTYTRAALASFILALALMLLLIGTRVYYTVCAVLILGLAILILVLPQGVKDMIVVPSLFGDSSGRHRLRMWTAAWRMFMDRPLLGQGLNTFMANYERFRVPDETGIWYAHNCYLQIAAETGIFGLLAFLWMIVKMTVVSFKSWKLINDEFLRYIYLGLFCGIISFLVHSAGEASLYSLQLAVLFYFSLGLLMGIKKIGLSGK